MDEVNNPISQEFASLILDSIVEGVFTVDAELRISYFNRAAEKITGFPKKQAIGRFCYDILKSNICDSNCPIRCSFSTGDEIIEKHKNIIHRDGKKIPVSINTSVLKDSKGRLIGGVETFRDLSTLVQLKKEIEKKYTFEDIVTKSPDIRKIFDILPNIAESDSSVLIQGSSGTGKELFARAIHNLSFRKKGPFVAVNCGALPEALIESELFGYTRGAFTDAKKDKPGRFALAENGTIFLDEVDSLPQATQVKLLRVLQEKTYEPLGSTVPHKANVRLISASKFELLNLVSKNKFRDDLYFRINVVKIEIPSLSDRRDDIPLLIQHFLKKYKTKMGKKISGVSHDVTTLLMSYDYPGNVRELENIIEHSFVMCQGDEILLQHLPKQLLQLKLTKKSVQAMNPIAQAEKEKIIELLEKNNWNKVKTAEVLGLNRTTLWRKMKKYQIQNKVS